MSRNAPQGVSLYLEKTNADSVSSELTTVIQLGRLVKRCTETMCAWRVESSIGSLSSQIIEIQVRTPLLTLGHPEEIINVSVSFPICKMGVMVMLAFLDYGVIL